jgi:hypothetical protein
LIEEDKRINKHGKERLGEFRWPLVCGSNLVVWVVGRLDLMICESAVGGIVVSSHRGVEVVSGPVRGPEVFVDVACE